MADRRILRCAIYTRKSTEYGLEQEFNSLDAQREAAEAYIKSQAHDGWRALPAHYDDGGISGGSLDRPALQALLSQIRERKVDIVVVYKVDRLTRSLADFAKLVELFDAHSVSFVSVTQQFNTTSSMGRLTLNVLLSFAQFEREVSGERIRDKIAASKRKGIRMGGPVPLGYVLQDKKLVVIEEEGDRVRYLFRRYLELGSLRSLQKDLCAHGLVSKVSMLSNGNARGGIPFSTGSLAYLLKNRVYVGEIVHHGEYYPGQHPAIVERELFGAVQAHLAEHAQTYKRARFGSASILIGRLFDDAGNRMTPTTSQKGGARYRYYESRPAEHKGKAKRGLIRRIPAQEIEVIVCNAVVNEWRNQQGAKSVPDADATPPDHRTLINRLVERVAVGDGSVEIILKPITDDSDALPEEACEETTRSIVLPFVLKNRRPMREQLPPADGVDDASSVMRADTRKTLVLAIAKARSWANQLLAGHVVDTDEIAVREGRSERHVRMMLPLAFLAPDIVTAAVGRSLPPDMGVTRLVTGLPMVWAEQHERLGLVRDVSLAG